METIQTARPRPTTPPISLNPGSNITADTVNEQFGYRQRRLRISDRSGVTRYMSHDLFRANWREAAQLQCWRDWVRESGVIPGETWCLVSSEE